MKTKPVSHKNDNTFRFSTFAERLNSINIDVIHRVGKTSQNPEDASTFFQEAIEKWNDLNYTEDYDALKNDIGYEISTLPQIVHRQNELVDILLKHLQSPENMALDATLELVVALSRDLQFEFYPSFPKFFVALTHLLETRNTELLEKIFTSLSYLFKFLWRYMLKDMENVYRLYSCLLRTDKKEHIRNFAAESFAFLIRKVQDKPKLFNFIFLHLKANPEQAEGVGQLFFEVVKGVKRQLHSSSKVVLKLLLHFLGHGLQNVDDVQVAVDLSFPLVKNALFQMLASVQKHALSVHAVIVEDVFCEIIEELLKNFKDDKIQKEVFASHLCCVLHLLCYWIQYQDAVFLTKNISVVQVLHGICEIADLSDDCTECLMEISALLLLFKNIDMPVAYVNSLLNYVYKSENRNLVFQFTRRMLDYGMFEKDVLPRLIRYCEDILQSPSAETEVLHILAETVVHLKPLKKSWEGVKCFAKLQLHSVGRSGSSNFSVSSVNNSIANCIFKKLEFAKESISSEILEEIWSCMVCLPHFKSLDVCSARKLVECVGKSCSIHLANCSNSNVNDPEVIMPSFVLLEAFICWLCLDGKVESSEHFTLKFFVDLFMKFPNCVNIMHVLDIYFSCSDAVEGLDDTILGGLIPALFHNLASPFHQVRLLTLQILCLLPCTLPANDDDGVSEEHSIFYICLQAEKFPSNVEYYREKLKWMRKLEFPSVQKYIPVAMGKEGLKAPVYYLLGCLYINFSLVWEPTIELLSSFGNEWSHEFWKIFYPYLCDVVYLAEKSCMQECSDLKVASDLCKNSSFIKCINEFCKHPESPDVQNHRLLLWKSMGHFAGVVRQKDNDIVTLLFRFIEKEVVKVDSTLASSEAISCGTKSIIIQEAHENGIDSEFEDFSDGGDDCDSGDEEESHTVVLKKRKLPDELCMDLNQGEPTVLDTGNSEDKRKRKRPQGFRFKKQHGVVKTLAAILSLFTKFKKPDSLHRTDELKKLYYELLSYHDAEIQKLSFNCIMTYNFNYLTPYKQNFYKILDDKTFKSEIVLFNIDKDNAVIQEDHRLDALAVLMRILYGKMLRKTGNNTSGKAQAHTRKMLVLRFLSGCRAEELKLFFNLVFDPFKEQLKDDVLTAVRNIQESIDLSSVIPIRKLRSALNTLEVILHNLGSLVPELVPWFLKVLLVIATTSSVLLRKQNELLPHCIKLIKLVRRQAVMRLIQFFKSFEHYNFSSDEIDAIFEAAVWPALPRLEFEAVNHPPPLLRLFDTWCSNSRYFKLLSKHHSSSETLSPLSHIVKLYVAENARPRVVGLLSKMFHSLLTLSDYKNIENEPRLLEIPVNNCAFVPEIITDDKEIQTFGMQLLFPYVGMIMKRLQVIVSKASKNRSRSLNSRELTILLRISSYIEDSEQCQQLIELLVPFFTHQKKLSTDCEVLVLSTIKNLIKKVDCLQPFLRLFAPLFSVLSHQRSRMSLVTVFSIIAERDAEFQIASIVHKINAWSPNLMDEPDYQMRLDGHSEALALVDEMADNFDDILVQILILNCSFMIRTCDDLSLRDSSSYLLQQLVERFSKLMESKANLFKAFVFDILLPEIKKGLKIKTEAARFEFVRVLAALLHNCGTHPRLSHLAQLCDRDRDMDFWENILHLQVHRRARALLKFSTRLKSGEIIMHPHELVSYMIPIVSSFFFDNAYNKHVHVIDAAIETFGSIVQHLPWSYYESILRYYLRCLSRTDHHKTVVKVIVSVLNSFHFDLSASHGIKCNLKELPAKIVKEKVEMTSEQKDPPDIDAVPILDLVEEETTNEDQVKSKDALDEEKATKIHSTIAKDILPQLFRSLMHKTKRDDGHKFAGNYYPEDEDILRVPIALAIVKLLQNLPHGSLEKNIPCLFLKMCQLLKSKTESIRETARDTLVKMMQSLGPQFFWYLLNEMRGVMKKGYQVHVMTFTVNLILQNLKGQFKSGDLDMSITDLTQVCMNELFGETAEEKEVAKITGKLKEARSSKSYSIYEILSQFISEACLSDLVSPLKEVLSTTRSHKVVKKIQECLRHISLGIAENSGITVKVELIFIHSLFTENLPLLSIKSKSLQVCSEKKYSRPDIYLIPNEPKRSSLSRNTNLKTNVHVLVDFSLQLLHLCLKRGTLNPSVKEHLEMVDPFVPILSECLDSNYIRIISTALRCFLWLFKFQLPSLRSKASHIINSSFVLINKYAGIGMGQGENFEMVVMCFKMLTVIVRDTSYHKLSEEQLRVLLSYIEQDIHDHTRQATAFSLLKAILSKKLQAPELCNIMSKISEMAITSEQSHIRTQCRMVSLQYILHYPLGKNLKNSLSFYVNQLEYMLEHGRVSALEMINSILNAFAPSVISEHAGLFLVPLAARLVNDEASKCRKMAASTIKSLLMKVDHNEKSNLFSIVLTWMENKKLSLRRLGAQLCGIFSEVEGPNFERFFGDVLSLICNQLGEAKSIEAENPTDIRCQDHFLYHLLSGFVKILSNCNLIKHSKFSSEMNSLLEHVQQLILHPHVWVRLAASQLFGLLFSSYTVEEVIEVISKNDRNPAIFFASRNRLRDLSADFTTQLQSPYLNEALGEQIIRNLVYLAKVISRLPEVDSATFKFASDNDAQNDVREVQVSVSWMIRKLSHEVKKEVAYSPQSSIKRKSIFKFFAAVALDLEKEMLFPLLPNILFPLCRELSDSSPHADESLKSLTKEVLDIFKKIIGLEAFTKVYAIVQNSLVRKKLKRKQDRAKEAVTDPQKFARKRVKKQVKKKEAKKRKILTLKGKKKGKKMKLSDLAIES